MASKVFYVSVWVDRKGDAPINKIEQLWDKAGFSDLFNEQDFVAIKMHFGEPGNMTFLSPLYVAKVVKILLQQKQRPFLTDGNTLYYGKRSNAVDHLLAAHRHGFTPYTVGAPVIIADGLNGRDHVSVPIDGKHFKEVKIGTAAAQADGMVSLAHVKGHMLSGFGGTLKNIGMGLGSRAGKQQMHADFKPRLNPDKCQKCLRCGKYCPEGAISLQGDVMVIDEDKCVGCGECVQNCYNQAIDIIWKTDNETFQEKMVEYFWGAVKGKPTAYINFVIDVSPDCDCLDYNAGAIVPDVGILASLDPIALEKASVDLINLQTVNLSSAIGENCGPNDDRIKAIRGIRWEHQLEYAQSLGLGQMDYELIEI